MKLDPSFIKNIEATYGEEGKTWLGSLSNHIKKLSEQWNFKLIQPVTDISYNFVAIVKLGAGEAILKTAPPQAKIISEAEWLKAHKKSVPEIFKIDKDNNAFLMEKIEPGLSLKYLVKKGDDAKATDIIAHVILDLLSADTLHQTNYQHISEHASSFNFLQNHIDKKMINSVKSIFNTLCEDRSKDTVLHGDLHHDNILQSDTTWKVIDPHGYIGDPCAEVGPMIYNPIDCFPQYQPMRSIIETRLKLLSEILPFDLDRIKAWTFCLTLRSIAWDIEGFGYPNKETVEIAKILYESL